MIKGKNVDFESESGVHRVQRVPETEVKGRIHTSAVTVAVLPVIEEVITQKDTSIFICFRKNFLCPHQHCTLRLFAVEAVEGNMRTKRKVPFELLIYPPESQLPAVTAGVNIK